MLLEETLADVMTLEALILAVQDPKVVKMELESMVTKVMTEIPALIRQRQEFSEWHSKKCIKVAGTVKSKRLRAYLTKAEENTLGHVCTLTESFILSADGVGSTTLKELKALIADTMPKVSPVVVLAFYARSNVEINHLSIIGILMPGIFNVRQ